MSDINNTCATYETEVTFQRMRGKRDNGPKGVRVFRQHLEDCSTCRLTPYTGKHESHAYVFKSIPKTDCGNLCTTGLSLWVAPEHMREQAGGNKGGSVSTEGVMRFMGFPRAV